MITLIILLIILNSSSSSSALSVDDLVREGYASYSTNQLEEAKEYLGQLMKEQPGSHIGQMLCVLVKVKERRNEEANRLLVRLNNCDIASPACDSPIIHVAARMLQGKILKSESMFEKADELISELSNNLYKNCYKTQIEIYLNNGNLQKVCEACDGYARVSDGFLNSDIVLKCFVANWSTFRGRKAKQLWVLLGPIQREELRKTYKDLEY